ncbi:uncharacterized protein LOC128680378 isoform X3 [Plodia interpunctella]|uniref:uncharacterized protein LOC128680378 isoform X3 n=1 Tax=Plodia interpunctella TaxID=58824 RepID=UPI002367C06F|nr:uncharacterized protein LOC128680378 isoform X3 [Plodia interpunctella]
MYDSLARIRRKLLIKTKVFSLNNQHVCNSVNYIETSYVDSTEKFDLTYPPTNTFTPTFYEDMTPVIANLTGPTSAEYPETTESPKNDSIWNVSWYIPPHRRGRTPMPYFKFEGVEYNELPEGHLYENNNDCDSYHNQCIRDEEILFRRRRLRLLDLRQNGEDGGSLFRPKEEHQEIGIRIDGNAKLCQTTNQD